MNYKLWLHWNLYELGIPHVDDFFLKDYVFRFVEPLEAGDFNVN